MITQEQHYHLDIDLIFKIRGFNASFLTKEVVSNEKDVRNFDFRSNIIRM